MGVPAMRPPTTTERPRRPPHAAQVMLVLIGLAGLVIETLARLALVEPSGVSGTPQGKA